MTNNDVKNQVLALFPDNANFEITASDMRMYVEAIFADKEVVIIKIPTASDLAFHNANIFEGSLVVIYNDSTEGVVGIYMSMVNQPTLMTDLIQLSSVSGGGSGSFERGGLLYDELKYYLIGDIVSVNTSAYICIKATAIPAGSFVSNDWVLISSGSIQIVDNVTSTSVTDALSANMGRELEDTKEPNLPAGNAGYVLTLGVDDVTRVWQPSLPNAIEWQSNVMYSTTNMVTHDGYMYRALQSGTSHQPDLSPTYWENVLLPEAPEDGKAYWRKSKGWSDGADYGDYL